MNAPAEAARSIRTAAAEVSDLTRIIIIRKWVTLMVELDQMRLEILSYETPLAEVRDSL